MTEAELWELLNAYNSAGLTALALYLTTASSFLVAAYLTAGNLTRYQTLVISGLFVIFAGLFTYGTIGYFERGVYFASRLGEYTDSEFRMRPIMPYLIGLTEAIGVVVCLVFMWQTNRRRA
jgi:uncharacterized membrane protein YesL